MNEKGNFHTVPSKDTFEEETRRNMKKSLEKLI